MAEISDSQWAQLFAGLAGTGASIYGKAQGQGVAQDALDRYKRQTPPQLQNVDPSLLGPSDAGAVNADPALRAAQMQALSSLGQIRKDGGLTLEDRAALAKIQGGLARNESAGRSQISNQMAARGQLGSGAELAMQLQNQQGSADRAQQAGMDTAAQAQKRYYDSILNQGQMAGQMNTQDFGQRMASAQARDAVSKYNTDSINKGKYYNAGLPAEQFKMGMQQNAGVESASGAVTKGWNGIAQDAGRAGANIGNTASEWLAPDKNGGSFTGSFQAPKTFTNYGANPSGGKVADSVNIPEDDETKKNQGW